MKDKLSVTYLLPVIAGCGLVGTCLGMCVNIAGNFFGPIAEDFGVGRGDIAMTLTLYNIVQALSGLAAPRLLDRFCIKKLVVFGTAVQAASTFALSLCNSVLPLYAFNVARGLASGVIGTVSVTMMINYWFNQNNALMTSIAMGFSGIVGAVMSPVVSNMIASSGWRAAYVLCAGVILALNLPALLLPIALRPEDKGLQAYGEASAAEQASAEGGAQKIAFAVFACVLVYAFSCSFTTSLPQHFPGIAESRGIATAGALMISACMVANTGGKVLLGALIDRIGARSAVSIFLVAVAAGAGLLLVGASPALLLGGAALYGLAYSTATVATSLLSREMFGMANYSRVYPKVALSTTIANAVGTSIVGYIYDFAGSYAGPIALMLGLLTAAFATLQLAYASLARTSQSPR